MTSPFTNPAGRAPEQASVYVNSILELLGDRDPLVVMSQLAQSLRKSIGRLSATELRRPEALGKWSMHEVVAHLADSEVVFGWRVRLVVAQDRPTITGFDQDAWSARVSGAYPDTRSAIQQIAVLREGHIALLRSLTSAQWSGSVCTWSAGRRACGAWRSSSRGTISCIFGSWRVSGRRSAGRASTASWGAL